MARHYATRDFFRQMPNPLLARYFHARGVFDDLDIAALPEPQPDALWAAWLTLDDPRRHAMDTATWMQSLTGTHVQNVENIVSGLLRLVDQFLTEYLRVNEAACNATGPIPDGGR